jgi:glycosyltransferase involved in cell wall biosynthesis
MITVITPVFNGERFIESCIDSVAAQRSAEVEHLIIDGASSDRTIEIIERKAAALPHLRFISERDSGQSSALNKGVRLARGEILGILNTDDTYEEGVLEEVAERFCSLPEPAMLVANCNVLGADGRLRSVNRPSELRLSHLLRGWRKHPFPMNPAAYFYHRSLHETIGLYDEDEHYAMDVEFILRAVQAATMVYVDEVWGNFWQVEGSKSVIDEESGLGPQRRRALYRRFRRNLPIASRIRAAVEFELEHGKPGRMLRFLRADPLNALAVWSTKPWRLIRRRGSNDETEAPHLRR